VPITRLSRLAPIGTAVADELAIAHLSDDATLGFTVLAYGGPALFLLAQLLFHHVALGRAPRSRTVALTALAVLAVARRVVVSAGSPTHWAQVTPIIGIAVASAVLIAVAITTVQAGVSGASEGPSRAQ
jgi:low temperature requirement protein LtrA